VALPLPTELLYTDPHLRIWLVQILLRVNKIARFSGKHVNLQVTKFHCLPIIRVAQVVWSENAVFGVQNL